MSEQTDFDVSLQKLTFLFRYTGMTVDSRKRRHKDKIKSRCMYLLNFFWLNTDLLGGIYWFIDSIKIGRTFVEITYIAPCIALSLLANLKCFFLVKYEDDVSELIKDLRCLEVKEVDADKIEIVNAERKLLNTVIRLLNILNVILVITFAVSPLVLIILYYFNTNEVKLMLPFRIIYPFNPFDMRYYPFVYLHQLWSEMIVILNICGADYLFYICCTYIRMQFRLLQYEFKRILKRHEGQSQSSFQVRLVKLVERHQQLIKCVNILEIIYGKSTLFNFLSSSILICLTGFNVMAMTDSALTITFLVFLFMSLLQIYFLCFFGDMVTRSGLGVSDAVYNSDWYTSGPSVCKNLLLVLTRAQKPCKLTAFGFADVNLRAYMSILSSAWSYFALLKTAYSSPRTQN